ncbi:MAG: cytochrome c [Acidimicrobiia bacterium]|nr:cytochrome c [Acidimicrobiia bacterium]MBT8213701.1 cytochrome c [Acidimicrobiia bacterium]NNF69860.1 cytochrome c [Acidimicrobiia bacterium]
MGRKIVTVVVLLGLLAAACGGGGDGASPSGEELFNETVLAGKPGCSTCHSLAPGQRLVGPSLAGIAATAATRVPGVSARDYLLDSLTDPNDYLVEGYDAGVMAEWDKVIGTDEINALVDYLLTLEP